MEKDNRNAYSEVIAILKLVDDEKRLEALPMEMLQVLKSKANPEYKPEISMEIPLDEQNLQPETLQILSWIATTYWNEEVIDETKETSLDIEVQENVQMAESGVENAHIENNELEQPEKAQTISQDDIKEKEYTQELEDENIEQSQDFALPIVYKDLKWYERIRMRIVEFFNKIFKRSRENKQEGSTL